MQKSNASGRPDVAAETMYARLFWIMVTVIISMAGGVVVFAFGVRSDINVVKVQLAALSTQFEEVKLDMRQRTELRYTSIDAAKDRDAFTLWNRDQDKIISELQVWRARVDQIMIDKKP